MISTIFVSFAGVLDGGQIVVADSSCTFLKVLCYLQFLKNKICSNCTKSLIVNPILSAKKWEFCDGMVSCYLTSPFFLQCYKPQYNSFKTVFDL